MSRSRSRSRSRVDRCALAVALGLAGVLLVAAPGSTAPAGDGRGATHVFETPAAAATEGEPVVSLTFDDGPHPTYTPQILDILGRHGVKATFFVLGSKAEEHPDLVRRIVAEGHAVANHTWEHEDLRKLDEGAFAAQVDRTSEVLEEISGQRQTCVRPPYGRSDRTVVERLAARGLTSVVWTADSRDFEKPGADAIVRSALDGLQPGAVILLHDGGGKREQTIAALPRIIDGIRAAGYRTIPICAPDPHAPFGALVDVRPAPGRIEVAGWAADPDTDRPVRVRLTVDGTHVGTATAEGAHPAGAGGPGYTASLRAGPGPHEVCAFAVDAGGGPNEPRLGCVRTEVGRLTAFDDLRPLAARLRFVQLVAQAEVVRDVVLAHDARLLPWTMDGDADDVVRGLPAR